MQFKKDLLKVFSSNFINLLIGLVSGFIIPAFLSLDDYAYLKTFTLYISYVGLLHFGFIDGIYIKYGGAKESDINKSQLKAEHRFLLIFQFLVTLIALILGIFLDDLILIAFSISILPINMQSLFKFFYQALGEFSIYSKIIILTPNLLLFFNLLIIFVLKIENYMPFIIANIVTNYVVFLGLEYYFFSKYKDDKILINYNELFKHIKVGFFIMIGNLSTMFFYSIDRWFVKFSLSTKDFAFYSFALSMLGIIQMLISSVTMIFYPYIARGQDEGAIQQIKKYLLIIGVLFSGGYFAFELIISIFLEKYIPSLAIVSILFAQFPVVIIINAIFVNLYKARKQERKYVLTVIMMCLVSIVLNVIAMIFYNGNLSIAIASTISYFVWYFFSAKHFSNLRSDKKEIFYLLIFLLLFSSCTLFMNWIIGMIVYYLGVILITYLLYKKDLIMLIGILRSK